MTRPTKQTVNYFPHDCIHSKTMFIIEQKYGNDGYAFWFKLLETLGATEGHCIHFVNGVDWEFLMAKTRLDKDKCTEILDLLATLGAIDKDLWHEEQVVWSDNFVENIKDAYRNRTVDIPVKPSFLRKKSISEGVNDVDNPYIKLNEIKVNNIKEDIPIRDIVELYNSTCETLSKVSFKLLAEPRKKTIRSRWKTFATKEDKSGNEFGLRLFEELFNKANESDFLSGRNGKWTSCNFDWLLNEKNLIKVLEGTYDNR
jgi:hypothetical protein